MAGSINDMAYDMDRYSYLNANKEQGLSDINPTRQNMGLADINIQGPQKVNAGQKVAGGALKGAAAGAAAGPMGSVITAAAGTLQAGMEAEQERRKLNMQAREKQIENIGKVIGSGTSSMIAARESSLAGLARALQGR